MSRRIEAAALRRMLLGDGEVALLDVREEGPFSEGHILLASSLPFGRIELGLDALVPRRAAPVVLCDAGEGLAERAAARMGGVGYSDVAVLDGGVGAWEAAGGVLFSGVFVPSKAFGEFVEHADGTPSVSAEELKAMLNAGRDLVVLDSRPWDEYVRMSIPTGIDCPGAELAYRVHDAAPDPDTLVVVNCAGRTRSIIGAQSLINAGVPNKVVALRNGTMGWELAGFDVARGQDRRPPEVSADGLARAQAAAARVAQRFGIRRIDRAGLAAWRAEADRRSLYLFDVRSPEEYAAGHVAGARSAPGGQLVQATDTYAATRGARIVLIDDTGVRATMTASWLIQMGWPEVAVFEDDLRDGPRGALETGPERRTVLGLEDAAAETIAPAALKAALDAGAAAVVDLARSPAYRAGHIPGAWFALRARLSEALAALPATELLALTSEDGTLARLAAQEAAAAWKGRVVVLDGGTAAWAAAGLPLEEGATHMASAPDDVWLRPYDRERDIAKAARAYLDWELGLVRQIEADGTARFRRFPA